MSTKKLEVFQRVLCLTMFEGKPVWLPGRVIRLMPEVGHVAVNIRKDYRQLVNGHFSMVLPEEFIFTNIEQADQFAHILDKNLDLFTRAYDNSDETWETMTSATDVQTVVGGESRCEDSALSAISP